MKIKPLLFFLTVLTGAMQFSILPVCASVLPADPVLKQMEHIRNQIQVADSLLQQMQETDDPKREPVAIPVQREILKDKEHFSPGLMDTTRFVLALILSGVLLFVFDFYFRKMLTNAIKRKQDVLRGFKIKDYSLLHPEQQLRFVNLLVRILRLILTIFLSYLALLLIFYMFPWTEGIAKKLFSLAYYPFRRMLTAMLQYLPNLLVIIPVIFISYYLIKIINHLKNEIASGQLNIKGFHRDFLSPTAILLKMMVFILTLIVTYPYLPGSQTKIFQGITLFLGVLLSLGSSSVVANIIAGLISIYMRPFKVGDYIRIGGVTGNVMEKNILITRLRTDKNAEITIPNSNILNGYTINFSAVAKDTGFILSTKIVVDYSFHWELVHEQLINAALFTPNILQHPAPFVCQISLSQAAATYELNAYTNCPEQMAHTYSLLHQQIQHHFKKSGIFLKNIN